MNRRDIIKLLTLSLGAAASTTFANTLTLGFTRRLKTEDQQLSSEIRQTIASVSEQIIPKTDTAGAIDTGVPDFVESVVLDIYNNQQRAVFFKGINWLNQQSVLANNRPFYLLPSNEQQSILRLAQGYEKQLPPPSTDATDNYPMSFFNLIKEVVVIGYFTSQTGAMTALAYNPMPMKYDGNYPLKSAPKQWSW